MKSPLVSVFLPYYNDADFLKTAIEAVLNQDFVDFELILLNHASTDDSRKIAHSYDDKRIVHIDVDKNLGAGSGYNMKLALKQMHGKYVRLLCADDVMHSNCLSKLVDFMEKNSDCDCVCSDLNFIDKLGNPVINKDFDFIRYSDFSRKSLLKSLLDGKNIICYTTVMMKKEVLCNLNIDNTFIMHFDGMLWADLLIKGYSICKIDDKLIDYRIHMNQTSRVFGSGLILENIAFTNTFNNIKDIDLVKYLCSDVSYVENLSKKKKKYIPFILAIHNLKSKNLSFVVSGYLYLYNAMNNNDFCDDVYKHFGFSIADFRGLYMDSCYLNKFLDVEYKKISIFKLLKLMFRRIFRVLTPKFYRNLFLNIKLKTKG